MVVLLGASDIVPNERTYILQQAGSKIVYVCSIDAYIVARIFKHRCNPSERVSLTVVDKNVEHTTDWM
jgi:hypothetical protein